MYISRKLVSLLALWPSTQLCLATDDSVSFPRQEGVEYIDGQYIIEYEKTKEGSDAKQSIINNPDKGIELVNEITSRNIHVVKFPSPDAAKKWMDANNGVKYMDQDTMMYVDTQSSTDRRNRNLAEEIPYGITHVKALDVSDDNAGNRKVCIVDSGYDINHPDLPSDVSLITGQSFIDGYDWDTDENDHGTHVAGTIVGLGYNGIGVMGVIRNGLAKLHISKVFPASGSTSTSTVIAGFESCVAAGANVINMSLGGGGYTTSFADAIEDAENDGILTFASSGNTYGTALQYPASYSFVISVASITENYVRSSFSTYNNEVDVCAPGSNVLSTIPGNNYAYFSGTSMACPHAVGVAALVWSNYPSVAHDVIRDILENTADDLGPSGYDVEYGHGLVNSKAALDAVTAIFIPTVSPRPSQTPSTSAPTLPCLDLEIDLLTDRYASETTWEVTDPNGSIVKSGNPTQNEYQYNYLYCLPPKCDYTFTIKDSFGDGICCGYGQGSYSVSYDGVQVISGGNFGSQESANFGCVTSTCDDSTSNFALSGGTIGCPYIANDPESFCDITSPINMKSHCPNTCSACDDYGCDDSEVEFTVDLQGGDTKDIKCSFIPSDSVEQACAQPQIRTTCRGTCNYCGL